MFPQASSANSDGETRLVWEPVGVAYGTVGTGLTEEATTGGTYVWARAGRQRSVADAIASKTTPARRSADLSDERTPTVFDVFPMSSSGRRDSSTTFGSNSLREKAAMSRVEQLRMSLNKWSSRKSAKRTVSFY